MNEERARDLHEILAWLDELEAARIRGGWSRPAALADWFDRRPVGAARRLGADPIFGELGQALHEWLRYPDHAERFSLRDLAAWLRSQPRSIAEVVSEREAVDGMNLALARIFNTENGKPS